MNSGTLKSFVHLLALAMPYYSLKKYIVAAFIYLVIRNTMFSSEYYIHYYSFHKLKRWIIRIVHTLFVVYIRYSSYFISLAYKHILTKWDVGLYHIYDMQGYYFNKL